MSQTSDEVTYDVLPPREDGLFEVVARIGKHSGWALQETEELAKEKAAIRADYVRRFSGDA